MILHFFGWLADSTVRSSSCLSVNQLKRRFCTGEIKKFAKYVRSSVVRIVLTFIHTLVECIGSFLASTVYTYYVYARIVRMHSDSQPRAGVNIERYANIYAKYLSSVFCALF